MYFFQKTGLTFPLLFITFFQIFVIFLVLIAVSVTYFEVMRKRGEEAARAIASEDESPLVSEGPQVRACVVCVVRMCVFI